MDIQWDESSMEIGYYIANAFYLHAKQLVDFCYQKL